MSLGRAPRQLNLLDENRRFCEKQVGEHSIYHLLHKQRDLLFPDEMFADLYSGRGRHSIPPSVVAVVMVLQRLEGLSDREAVEALTFDLRWKYAAGVEGFQEGFVHTVLVNMRARLIGVRRVPTPPRSTTRWPPRTRSPSSARRSGGCSGWPGSSRAGSAQCFAGTTITCGRASPAATGRTPWPGRRWWTSWWATAWKRSRRWRAPTWHPSASRTCNRVLRLPR